jgi:hypothetical protein
MPTMNVYELYEQTIKSLPAAERLRLAVLILNDIPPQSVVDASERLSGNLCLGKKVGLLDS